MTASPLFLGLLLLACLLIGLVIGRLISQEKALNEANEQFGKWIEAEDKRRRPPRHPNGQFKRRGF